MKKTSIYLSDELDVSLARRAEEEGLSKAELIRRELTRAIDGPRRPLPSIAVIAAGGPRTDAARTVDRTLRQTGFGDPPTAPRR